MANNLPILSDKVPDLGDRAPTPEEIIGWLKEQAFSMGRIGFSTVFQPHRTAELMQADLDLKQDISPTYGVPTPASTLGFCVGQWEREQYISKKLLQNQRVVKEAGAILDKRLLAAGMSQQDLAKLKKVSPLQKVVELYKIENPPPKGPERVMVKILRKTDKGTQLQEAYLPVEDTLDDLKPALNRLSAYMDGRGEYVQNQAHGPWVYQLVERSSSQKRKTPSKGKSAGHKKPQAAVEQPRKYLSVDADWKELANFLRKEGNKAPIVVLCQESTVHFEKELAAQKEEEDKIWNAIDENGNPYFQDVDWEMMINKEFGELAKMDEEVRSKAKTEPSRRSARLKEKSPVKRG